MNAKADGVFVGDRVMLNGKYCGGYNHSIEGLIIKWYSPVWVARDWYVVDQVITRRSPRHHKKVPVVIVKARVQERNHNYICVVGVKQIEELVVLPRRLTNALDVVRRQNNFQTFTEEERKEALATLDWVFARS
jgi:hypothetical protein